MKRLIRGEPMSKSHRFFEILSSEQVRQIHLNALRVLEEVGMWLPNREVLELLHDAGAKVNFDAKKVLFPPHTVETSIKLFPPRFTWYVRNTKKCLDMNGVDTYFSMPDSAINIMDLEGQRRPGTAPDGENICRLCDALSNMAVASTGVNPPDMPRGVLEAWLTKTMYTKSSKAVFGVCRSRAISQMILRMAEVVANSCDLPDGQLPIVAIMNPFSPLYNEPEQLEGMLEYIRRGVPLSISPEVQGGATGPATLAGVMVQQTAEFLGHATIAQLIIPGLPVVYGTVSSVFDMRKMILPYGAPEADLLAVATTQMARYYGIPSRTTGSSSDANALGMQAGAESLMSTLLSIMAGATLVLHGAGELENTMTVSYEKILIDEEIIDLARRFVRGIEFTPETLAFEVIKEVGPRGHFLATDHTVDHFRTEHFMPNLLVRDEYEAWKEAGRKRAEERAADRARELLQSYEPAPLPYEAVRELEAIFASAKKTAGME